MEHPLAAIVLAAGLGTRMKSARAKVLHQLAGEAMIARALRAIASLATDPLIVVVGHQRSEVRSAAERALTNNKLLFAHQTTQRGTGDAARIGLSALPTNFRGDVLIGYGDMPALNPATLRDFISSHRGTRSTLSFISTRVDAPGSYGRVIRDRDRKVTAIVEARDANPAQLTINEINTGIYLGDAQFLREALNELQTDNSQGEFYLTDIVAIAHQRQLGLHAWIAPDADEFAGINSREELASMEKQLREDINRQLMAAGVTLIDPANTYIGSDVVIGADTTVGPNVQILGRSRIGAGVLIEGTAWLRDVTIGDRCHLKLGVRAESCIIGDDCEIGPFANLREGTHLEGHNRIGNFVETKKARVGRGSKASHLSYLGDAIIGEDTNIGCGVITVNYDGYDKHQTEIGDNCMVGCDTQLIAPVKVGDDVYVASGATILKDVQNGALVMTEHRQREKTGWTAQWHKRHQGHPKAAGGRREEK